MRHIKQFSIILFFSLVGELLSRLIPLSVPASIYGLILMFLALKIGILKLSQVQDAAGFLVDIMILTFLPAAVGLVESWSLVREILLPASIIIFVTTILVMAFSGWTTQWLYRLEKRNKR